MGLGSFISGSGGKMRTDVSGITRISYSCKSCRWRCSCRNVRLLYICLNFGFKLRWCWKYLSTLGAKGKRKLRGERANPTCKGRGQNLSPPPSWRCESSPTPTESPCCPHTYCAGVFLMRPCLSFLKKKYFTKFIRSTGMWEQVSEGSRTEPGTWNT